MFTMGCGEWSTGGVVGSFGRGIIPSNMKFIVVSEEAGDADTALLSRSKENEMSTKHRVGHVHFIMLDTNHNYLNKESSRLLNPNWSYLFICLDAHRSRTRHMLSPSNTSPLLRQLGVVYFSSLMSGASNSS